MKTYLEWNYDTPPPIMKVLEVAVNVKNYRFTRRAVYMNGNWFDNETLQQFTAETNVYAWAYILKPPPFDIDAA
jgi:hypothetical protein